MPSYSTYNVRIAAGSCIIAYMSLRYLSVVAFGAVLCHAQSGVIHTVIGTGAAGASGDGGPGANAQLNTPNGVAVDAAGNVYIADYANSRIRKLLTSDFTQTIAGCGGPPACLDQTALAGRPTAIFSPWDGVVDAEISTSRTAPAPRA